MAYDDDPIIEYDYPYDESSENESRRKGCVLLLSILIIIAMIGISLPALFWLYSLRPDPASSERAATIVEVTREVTKEVTATAVPAQIIELPVTATPSPIVEDGSVNRIAFINEAGQIVTIKPNGEDAHQVTETVQRFQYPAWSPDSSQLAVIGQDRAGGAVFVVDAKAEDAEPRNLYNDNRESPFYLYWSPNGEQISFIANNRSSGIALHVVPVDGSDESRIISSGAPFYWHWADNGEELLIHSGGTGFGGRVEMIEATDGDANNELGRPGFFQSPGISANGRYWAYAERTGSNSHVTIMDTETKEILSEQHTGLAALSWSPTDALLAYTSGDSPESESFIGSLRLFNAETGEVTLLSRDTVVGFFWSPNGRYIAALSFLNPGEERDVNVSVPKSPVGKPSQQGRLPELELVIFDMETLEGQEIMRYVPTLAFLTQFLPFFDQYALSHRIWSPDSESLVLPMIEDNRSKIYTVSVETGQRQYLADGSMPFWSLR